MRLSLTGNCCPKVRTTNSPEFVRRGKFGNACLIAKKAKPAQLRGNCAGNCEPPIEAVQVVVKVMFDKVTFSVVDAVLSTTPNPSPRICV